MRAFALFVCGVAALGAPAACAESDDRESPLIDSGSVGTVIPDAASEIEGGAETSAPRPTCSTAGWCATPLPDKDLILVDIWPLASRAFAIATSPTIGVKILEWTEADSKWRYIDDGSQNEPGVGDVPGMIWAPSEDEIYFGVSPRFIYRGKRSPLPEPGTPGTWTWTRRLLPNEGLVATIARRALALGVWGTGPADVYAWFGNTIYHWKAAADGAGDWVSEYVAADTESEFEFLFFTGAGGTGPDDVWFSGGRTRYGSSEGCAIVVRRTGAGYRRLADGIVSYVTEIECAPRPGTVMIGGRQGVLRDLQAVAAGQLVGLKGQRGIVRITAAGDSMSAELAPPLSASLNLYDSDSLDTVWAAPGVLWASGAGIVFRGVDVWAGGKYAISSMALGDRLFTGAYRVRGSSDKNLWAVGPGVAFHKTTP